MTPGVNVRRGEAAVAFVLLCLALYVIWAARGMPAGTVALPGPGFFPIAVGALLAVVSLGVIVRLMRQRAPAERVPLGHRDVAIAMAALLGVAIAFEPLGAVLTLGLLLFVLFAAFARIPLWKAAVGAALGAGFGWFAFVYLLGVQLPRGVL